ncbi:hypothetical protein BC567DRAFT_234279 [Phyllosticta citribraziliensis]
MPDHRSRRDLSPRQHIPSRKRGGLRKTKSPPSGRPAVSDMSLHRACSGTRTSVTHSLTATKPPSRGRAVPRVATRESCAKKKESIGGELNRLWRSQFRACRRRIPIPVPVLAPCFCPYPCARGRQQSGKERKKKCKARQRRRAGHRRKSAFQRVLFSSDGRMDGWIAVFG